MSSLDIHQLAHGPDRAGCEDVAHLAGFQALGTRGGVGSAASARPRGPLLSLAHGENPHGVHGEAAIRSTTMHGDRRK